MLLLQNLVGSSAARDVKYPISIAIGDHHAGIAQVVFDVVLAPPGNGSRYLRIDVEITPFGVENALYPFAACTILAVLNAARQVVLHVGNGAIRPHRFAQFGACGIVQKLDAVVAAERDQRR